MASDSDQELSFVIIPDEDGGEHFPQTTTQPTIMNVFRVHHGHNMHSQSGMSLEQKGTSGDDEKSDGSFVMLYPEVGCPNHYSTKCNTENPNMYSSKIELNKETEVKDSGVTEKGNMGKPEAKEAVEAAIRYSDSNNIPDEKRYSEESNNIPDEKRYSEESNNIPDEKRYSEESNNIPDEKRYSEESNNIPDEKRYSEESNISDEKRYSEESNNIPDEKRYSEESHGFTSVHSLDTPTDTHDVVSTAQNQASFGTLPEMLSPQEETTKSTLTSLSPSTAHQSGHAHPMPAETTRMDTKRDNYGTYFVDFQPDSQGDHFKQWQHHYQPQPFIPGTVPPFESPTSSGGTRVPLAPGVLHTKPRNVIPGSTCQIQSSRTAVNQVQEEEHVLRGTAIQVGVLTPPAESQHVCENLQMNTVAVENLGPNATEETLTNYFENKRRCGGGPVRDVKIDVKKRKAFVTFENPEDAKNVTTRDHTLDECKLKIVLSKPPEVMKDHVMVRGLPDSVSREQLISFVESSTDFEVQTVLYGKEGVAVIVFKTEIDISTVTAALTKRQLQDHNLSVEEVPVSCTILVKFEKNKKLSKDDLTLFFGNVHLSDGSDVTEVVMGENGEYALVTFEDSKVATSVAKKEHKFKDLEMDVTIWMECLGINGGSEEPVMKPVDPVAISSSDQWKISLLKEGCQVMLEDLENELQKHHARLDWSDPERSVQLVCCLTPQTPGARELAKTWAENVINVLQNHLSTVKVEEVKVTREEYIEMAPLLQGETGEARVRMTCDEKEGRVFIVWDRDETVYIVRNLQSTINKFKEKFNRKKREKCVHKEINKWKMLLLKKEKTDQKLKDKFPQLEVTYDFEECCMILKGVDEEIHEMELLAQAEMNKIISRSHNWTSSLAKQLLTCPEAKTVFESICSGQDSECVLELTLNGFFVHSFNEEKANEVLMIGQRALEEHVIPLAKETKEARRLPQWEELKTSIQERNRGLVLIQEKESSLTVVGINTPLNFEIQQLREFLNENGNYQYSSLVHDVYSQLLLTFMSENLDTRRQQEDFRIDDILFDDVTTSIVVKGNKTGIHAAQEAKNHFDRTLVCKRKTFTQPCMKEFLKCTDWQSRRTKIEQKLKCRILEPAECPPELASIAVDATIQKGELSQEVSALAPAPVQANSTATMLAEGHRDTNQKSKKEMQRKSEHASLAKLMKMRIFLQESSDITKQEHDVLVNSSNTSLNLELGQVSKALVKVGGSSIQKDCKKKYPRGIKMGDIAISCAGNLKRVKILFHCCLPEEKDPNKIRNVVAEVVRKCLQLADQSKLSSIGFPALGTGFLKYPPDLVAEAMYQATIDYSIEHPDCKVTDVFFVLLRQDTAIIQAFTAIDALYKEFNTDSLLSAGPVLRQTNPNAQGIQTYPHFEHSHSDEILFFVANSFQVIEEAERELLECYHGKIKTLSFDVPHLDQWDDDHVTTIRNAGHPGYIDVTFDYARSRLALRGFEDTVRVLPVHTMITDADKHVQCKVQADLMAKQVQWSAVAVSETEEVLQSYSRINNYLIETAYSGGKTSVVVKCERTQQHVNINFAAMEELPENPDVANGVIPMRIIRHDLLEGMALDAPLPDRWTDMKGEIDVVPLSSKNPDYRRVAEAFNKIPKQHQQKIKTISRVQNKTLHKQYMAMKKQIVATLPPGKRCERDNMWHGTKEGSVDGIVRYGFNRSYSNCDANKYGQGVYFATEAEYSIRDAYATRNSRGERYIFMCKVLVGEYTVGKPEMRFPPEIPGSNGRRYNSVVNDKEKPSTFVIFSDVQAYPEYLIEFK